MLLHDIHFSNSKPIHSWINWIRATAGQEDPFELDSNLLLLANLFGEDRKRQLISVNDLETPLLGDMADLCDI